MNVKRPQIPQSPAPRPSSMFRMRAWMSASNSLCGCASRGSHCSQFKNGELLPETPEPTRQRFYEILDFLPRLKKERTFSIPAVLNPQKSLRKAQSKGRKRLAGLRALRPKCPAIVLRAPGGRECWRGELRGCHGDQKTQDPCGNNCRELFH